MRDMRGRRRVRERYGVFLFTWSRQLDLALCSCRTYTSICKSGNCEHLQMCLMLCHLVLANKFNCHSHPPLCCNIHVIWHPRPTHPAPTRCMVMLFVVVVYVLLSSSGSRRRCAFHTKKNLYLQRQSGDRNLFCLMSSASAFSLCVQTERSSTCAFSLWVQTEMSSACEFLCVQTEIDVFCMCIFSLYADRDVFCMCSFSLCADRDVFYLISSSINKQKKLTEEEQEQEEEGLFLTFFRLWQSCFVARRESIQQWNTSTQLVGSHKGAWWQLILCAEVLNPIHFSIVPTLSTIPFHSHPHSLVSFHCSHILHSSPFIAVACERQHSLAHTETAATPLALFHCHAHNGLFSFFLLSLFVFFRFLAESE